MQRRPESELPAAARLILEAAHRAPSADNTQPWRFVWNGRALHVGFDPQRMADHIFTPKSRASQLTMGAMYENVVQVARDAGLFLGGAAPSPHLTTELALRVEGATPPGQRAEAWLEGERAHPVFSRHTNREAYSREPLPEPLLRELGQLEQDTARVRVFAQRGQIKRVAKLVQLASEARFRTQELHEWLYGSLRFPGDGRPADEGLALETLGLPPGGGVLLESLSRWSTMSRLNRLKLFKLLARVETATFERAPALVAILAPKAEDNGYTPQHFAAGRVMERAWVAINRAGFAAHPSYVITDQLDRLVAGKVRHALRGTVHELRRAANGIFVEGGDALCVLFRVGRPKRAAVRSRRRPLEATLRSSIQEVGGVR